MALTTAGKNAILNSGKSGITQMSLHTGNPGTTGTSEVTGAPYTRQNVTWTSASNGAISPTANVVFDIPVGNITVTHVGLWAGATYAGTSDSMTPTSQPFTNGGQYVLTSAPFSLI